MSLAEATEIEVVRSSILGSIPHGFAGRRGGVSEGAMWGLNTGYGSGDDPDLIRENRRRVIDSVLPRAELATVHQIHSAEAVVAESPWPEERRPRADALVTDRPGLLLGILTADCAPVLLADQDSGVVGAAHAGWRGAAAGVTDSTIEAMERLGATRDGIVAVVGPCISSDSYEVDRDFERRFLDDDPDNDRFFVDHPTGNPRFDLQAYVVHRLLAAGIGEVESVRLDTYSLTDRFFSYRRSSHLGEPDYGRQISVIGLGR